MHGIYGRRLEDNKNWRMEILEIEAADTIIEEYMESCNVKERRRKKENLIIY